jgi:hypothetical protein
MGLLDDAIREHLDLQRRRGADPTEVQRAEREALGPVRRAPESASGADDEVHEPDGVGAESPPGQPEAFEAAPESESAVHEPAVYEPESYEPATQVAPPPEREAAFDHEADSWSYEDSQPEPGAAAPPPPLPEPPLPEPPLPEPPLAEPPLAEQPPAEAAPADPPPDERPRAETEEDVFGPPPPPPTPRPAPPPRPARTAISGETEEYDVEAALNSESKGEGAEGEDVLEETPEFLQDTPDHDRLWFEQRPPKDFDFDG